MKMMLFKWIKMCFIEMPLVMPFWNYPSVIVNIIEVQAENHNKGIFCYEFFLLMPGCL